MKKMILFSMLFLLFTVKVASQRADTQYYENAYKDIFSILTDSIGTDYKSAVFITENSYFDNKMDKEEFNRFIRSCAFICKRIIQSGNIIYPEKDKQKAIAQCAVFLFMVDSISFNVLNDTYIHTPFEYNFEDFSGEKDWTNMFVSTLMETKRGNCHSLPILYKLIMDKLGEEASLALSPNHMYIKVNNKRVGWYNVELTCGDFPTDAWIMASGFVHLDAIRNGVYMKALTDKESVALCLIDLAQGYERKFGTGDGGFIIKCCDTALQYFPNCINALLLKAETLTSLYEKNNDKELLHQMNEMYSQIHKLGYRKMPQQMYMNWLTSLSIENTNHRIKDILFPKTTE